MPITLRTDELSRWFGRFRIVSNDPTLPLPQQHPPRGPAPQGSYQERYRRRRHRGRRWGIAALSLIVVLVIADRAGNAIAENDFATQAQQSGFPVRPSVDITGFPFLTQLAARDFRQVDFSAQNVPAGPLSISRVSAVATGVHVNSSFNGATVDHITGTGLVTFDALTSAGSGGSGGSDGSGVFSMTADGPNRVQVSAGPVTEEAQVQQTGPDTVSVQMLDNGDLLSGILSSFGSFSFTMPKLPGGMRITSVRVTTQGVVVGFAASHAQLTQ